MYTRRQVRTLIGCHDMRDRIYVEPCFFITQFETEDVLTVSTPVTTEDDGGVQPGTDGGGITVPFSDLFP